MSLDWNATEIRDHEEVLAEGTPWAITQSVIFGCMGTGIGRLTEQNVGEYIVRAKFLQLLDGPWLQGPDGPVEVTASDIRRRIGLSTNVFPQETRAQWLKRVVSHEMDRRVRDEQRAHELGLAQHESHDLSAHGA